MTVTCLVVVDNNQPEEMIFERAPQLGDHVSIPGSSERPHPIVRVAHSPVRPDAPYGKPSIIYFVSRSAFLYDIYTGAIEGYSHLTTDNSVDAEAPKASKRPNKKHRTGG